VKDACSRLHPAFMVDELIDSCTGCAISFKAGLVSALLHCGLFAALPMLTMALVLVRVGCVPVEPFLEETAEAECSHVVWYLILFPYILFAALPILCSVAYMGSWYLSVRGLHKVLHNFTQCIEPLFVLAWVAWFCVVFIVLIQCLLWLLLNLLTDPAEYFGIALLIATPAVYVAAIVPMLHTLSRQSLKQWTQETLKTVAQGLVLIVLVIAWTFVGLILFSYSGSTLSIGPALTGAVGAIGKIIGDINRITKESGKGKDLSKDVKKVLAGGGGLLDNENRLTEKEILTAEAVGKSLQQSFPGFVPNEEEEVQIVSQLRATETD